MRGGPFFHCFSKRTGMSPDHGERCSNIQIWLNKNKIQTIPRVLSSSCDAPALPNQPFAVIAANRITAPPTDRHGHNLVLLKFTIKQHEIVWIHLVWHGIDTSMRSRPSVSVSPRRRLKPEMTWYPRSIIPAGLKNEVNSVRSVERNNYKPIPLYYRPRDLASSLKTREREGYLTSQINDVYYSTYHNYKFILE